MEYKVLALDIDGTLTNSKKKITDRTKAVLLEASRRGVKLVLASGRPVQGIVSFARELGLDKLGGYILSFNGGRIIECANDEIVWDMKLPLEYLPEISALAAKYNVSLMTYEGDDVICPDIDNPYLAIEARINGLGIRKVDDIAAHVDFPINKCLMLGDGDYLAEVEKKVAAVLSDRLDVYRSEPFFLEILPKNVHKAAALSALLDTLGLKRENLMACGDGFNDISMLEFAGLGVAMANSSDLVKERADYVTLSNDEDGVAYAVEKFVLNC